MESRNAGIDKGKGIIQAPAVFFAKGLGEVVLAA